MLETHPELRLFSSKTARWFSERYGAPTDIQAQAWPLIAAGEHLLASAPTGCGKTMAAFLWAIDRLYSGAWQRTGVRVLYVSPLRALNNDIERNLLVPISELGADIRVATRSGDTSSTERQRVRKHPPDILITTPESLNVLLTSKSGRALFGDLKVVILDEIHAVVGQKRGTHLMTAVERLVPLAGEFQRIALSATVRPIGEVATWVAGRRIVCVSPLSLEKRPIRTLQDTGKKRLELSVTAVPTTSARTPDDPDTVWHGLARLSLARVAENRSTLIFGSGRRAVEKITRFINTVSETEEDVAYAHHGSLAKEIRTVVETRLKEGKLKAIVATSSLELGIDIGALDEVIQVQTPFSVAALVQRIGRAGHGVGQTSKGLLVPMHQRDVLSAMVVARLVLDGELESIVPATGGLDVLAQVILSMTATECWQADELYAVVSSCSAYSSLARSEFDDVLEMLAGRFSQARIRSLDARVLWDKVDGTVQGKRGVDRLVYGSGGTIPDRGYFQLRLADTKARLGELDEEFVWERSLGDSFTLGTRSWQIEEISHNDVFVRPTKQQGAMIPFWRGEERDRGFFFAEHVARFLEEAEALLANKQQAALYERLREEYPVTEEAAHQVLDLLMEQRRFGKTLPHRHHVLVEYVRDPHNNQERRQVVLHTFWGGQVNRPLAMAMVSAWQQHHGHPLDVMHTDDCVVLALQEGFSLNDMLKEVRSDTVQDLVQKKLHRTGLFGARFRENAGRALLLPRGDFRRRLPLWLNRMRSKKLMAAVSETTGFPMTRETWRECLQDALDLENLAALLDELHDGEIEVSEVFTDAPSPFAKEVVWKTTNVEMYNDDRPSEGGSVSVDDNWMREVVMSAHLRPRIERAVTKEFEAKVQRTFPGYAPRCVEELLDWLKERVLLPHTEWTLLVATLSPEDDRALAEELLSKASWHALGDERYLVSAETMERLPVLSSVVAGNTSSLDAEGEEQLRQVLRELFRFTGPRSVAEIAQRFALRHAELLRVLSPMVEDGEVVLDALHADSEEQEVCDAQNLETLLRWQRRKKRSSLEARSLDHLGCFWAHHQGLVGAKQADAQDLSSALSQLVGVSAPAGLWETDLLPARFSAYFTRWLDDLFTREEVVWRGTGPERIALVSPDDLQLLWSERPKAPAPLPGPLQDDGPGRYRVRDLMGDQRPEEVIGALWDNAWCGYVSNDSFESIRRGVKTKFRALPRAQDSPQRAFRQGARMRLPSRPMEPGSWFRLPFPTELASLDALEQLERNKELARILLDRYGVLFREVVQREGDAFAWRDIFTALRLMELSGEVVVGQFFEGIDGLQFASMDAVRTLRAGFSTDEVYWLHAMDPACPNGLGISALSAALPHRRRGTHIVFSGLKPVIVSTSQGKTLTIDLALDVPDMARYFDFFRVALSRDFAPRRHIEIETINGVPAPRSPWRSVLSELFRVSSTPRALLLE